MTARQATPPPVDRATLAFSRLRELGGDTCLVHGRDGVARYRVQHRLYEDRKAAELAAVQAIREILGA